MCVKVFIFFVIFIFNTANIFSSCNCCSSCTGNRKNNDPKQNNRGSFQNLPVLPIEQNGDDTKTFFPIEHNSNCAKDCNRELEENNYDDIKNLNNDNLCSNEQISNNINIENVDLYSSYIDVDKKNDNIENVGLLECKNSKLEEKLDDLHLNGVKGENILIEEKLIDKNLKNNKLQRKQHFGADSRKIYNSYYNIGRDSALLGFNEKCNTVHNCNSSLQNDMNENIHSNTYINGYENYDQVPVSKKNCVSKLKDILKTSKNRISWFKNIGSKFFCKVKNIKNLVRRSEGK